MNRALSSYLGLTLVSNGVPTFRTITAHGPVTTLNVHVPNSIDFENVPVDNYLHEPSDTSMFFVCPKMSYVPQRFQMQHVRPFWMGAHPLHGMQGYNSSKNLEVHVQ